MIEIRGMQKYYIYLTLFFTGAAIMVLELLGTRVIGPYYGVSLYVWSSLISVTMVALAVGYWLGGKVADKAVPTAEGKKTAGAEGQKAVRLLYRLVLAAGISIMLLPVIAGAVLKGTLPLGIRGGALASAFVLFTVPLVLLGMVTPYAIKILTDRLKVVGARAGNLFAVSTVGSFAGTVLTGFVLIPSIGTKKMLYLQAGALVVLWAVWELMGRRYITALIAVPLLGFCMAGVTAEEELAHAGGFEVKHKTESFYGELKVIDRENKRWLSIDGAGHTGINKDTGLSLFPYSYYIEVVNYMRPGAKDALVVGLGGGSVTRRLEGYGLRVDSVEINPKVADIARRFFGFDAPEGNVHITDGRVFISNADRKYDFIVLDAFAGSDTPPFHLMTKEMFGEIKGALKEDGILAVNSFGFMSGKGTVIPQSIHRTLGAVYPNVRAFRVSKENFGNIIFFASAGELALRRSIEKTDIAGLENLFAEMLEKEVRYSMQEGIVITDDYNPLEAWGVMTSEAMRRDILSFLPAEVLAL